MGDKQRGFTLFEVLTATTCVMALAVPAAALLYRAFAWSAEIDSQLKLNREAREVSEILLNGGKMGSAGTDTTTSVYGLRARAAAPAGTLRSNYVLNYTSNSFTLSSSNTAPMTVTCKAAGNPLPDCAGTETKAVQGWLGGDIAMDSTTRSVGSKTTEVTITMVDPYQAQRMKNNPARAVERYRMVVQRKRDETDP
jgi:hypothetical protein